MTRAAIRIAADPRCLDCDMQRTIAARGICATCYSRRAKAGTLADRPPLSERTGGGLADSPLDEGLTYRRLDYWSRQGYLKPENPTPGSGSWRRWPESERVVARMMVRLTEAGLSVAAAHEVARAGGRLELAPGVVVEVSS